MEGKSKTNFSKRLEQFDGLIWLTLAPPYFTTDLHHWCRHLEDKFVGNQLYRGPSTDDFVTRTTVVVRYLVNHFCTSQRRVVTVCGWSGKFVTFWSKVPPECFVPKIIMPAPHRGAGWDIMNWWLSSVCLSVCPSVCMSVCMSVCLSVPCL